MTNLKTAQEIAALDVTYEPPAKLKGEMGWIAGYLSSGSKVFKFTVFLSEDRKADLDRVIAKRFGEDHVGDPGAMGIMIEQAIYGLWYEEFVYRGESEALQNVTSEIEILKELEATLGRIEQLLKETE